MSFILPKGVRDYGREQTLSREWIRNSIKEVYELYGFMPYEPPCLEKLEVLFAKCGGEVKDQVFRIEDSDIGLRYDLTVGFVRKIANSPELKPIKRYWIGKVWRREEPQRLRLREFWQADADVVGMESPWAEIELICMANDALRKLGIKPSFVVNSRRIVDTWLCEHGVDKERGEVMRLLDKVDKVGVDDVVKQLSDNYGMKSVNLNISLEDVVGWEDGSLIVELIKYLKKFGVEVEYKFSLVRGLDYYDGIVFEILASGVDRSLGGGGRYDSFLKLFGGAEPISGFGIGVDRIYDVLGCKIKNASIKALVVSLSQEVNEYAFNISSRLRNRINVFFLPHPIKLSKCFKYAEEHGIRFVVILGNKEMDNKEITIRDVITKRSETFALDEGLYFLFSAENSFKE